jgi:glycosyltransferase involved in cell wall biosynthesis
MRICMIMSLPYPPEDGLGNYVHNLSKELIKKGNSITIITRGSLNTVMEDYDGIRVYKVRFLPLYPFHVQVHGLFVQKLIEEPGSSFDIIHIHTPMPPAIRTKLPIITTVHTPTRTESKNIELVDLLSIGYKLNTIVSYTIEQDILGISDKVTAVSNSVRNELIGYGLSADNIEVLGNGVDESIFYPIHDKTDKKYILYTGRLSYRKGLFDFMDCAREICSKYPDINFKLVGKGPLLDKLKKLAVSWGYEDRFEFLGFIDKADLIRIYQNATLYVLPSHYEGLPTTLLEAMACGLPIIATAVSGSLDVIVPGENGILVPARSPGDMANAVSLLLDDDKKRNELGKAARRTIEDRYTWDKISDKILHCYSTLRKDMG